MRVELAQGEIPADLIGQLEAAEGALVAELSARPDTSSILFTEGEKLVGYAVVGLDQSEMVTVYAARSLSHFVAKAAMLGIFGAAQVVGRPMRVHTEKIRAMARMLGAERFASMLDGDGLRVGVLYGQPVQ